MPANLPPGYTPETDTAALQGGIPWEQKGGSLIAKWWDTVKAANNNPRPFFAACAQNEKGDAILFALISGLVSGAFIGALYLIVMVAVGAGFMLGMPGGKGSSHSAEMFAAGLSVGIGLFYAIFIMIGAATGAMIRPFLWGGIHHLVLMLFGGIGQGRSFMHTVRVAAYSEGAALPWVWIPLAGPFIALFYLIRNITVGYDETHRCGVGRALVALFSPAICCCLCLAIFSFLGAIPAFFKP